MMIAASLTKTYMTLRIIYKVMKISTMMKTNLISVLLMTTNNPRKSLPLRQKLKENQNMKQYFTKTGWDNQFTLFTFNVTYVILIITNVIHKMTNVIFSKIAIRV
jgi:hypothetical protein